MARFLQLVASLAGCVRWVEAGSFHVRDPPESLCPSAGKGMVGYYDFNNDSKHLFFWFAESRVDPLNDPIVLWMSGGPGASSVSFGLFDELGPCLIDGPGSVKANPFAWNRRANVIFVDQPAGVGFSYSETPIRTLEEATSDMYGFLVEFVEQYPQYSSQDLYIVGESFGGTWVPALAREIHHRQSSALSGVIRSTSERNDTRLNLKGIALGNAQLSQSLQWPGFFATGCAGEHPIFNKSTCAVIETEMSQCVEMLKVCSRLEGDVDVCSRVLDYCRGKSVWFIAKSGLNPYDFRKACKVAGLCYEEPIWIQDYLNSTEARKLLTVPDGVDMNVVDTQLFERFTETGVLFKSSVSWVEELLDQDYRVLIYVGDKDWYCNVEGERQMANSLRWKHQPRFQALEEQEYALGGRVFGTFKQHHGLAFVDIFDAGHMVPTDKGEEALFLMDTWLRGPLESTWETEL